jgi:steroid delta-isomerase-like uncharacterized protein
VSESDNKDTVMRQWYQELWDNWNIGVAEQLFSPDYVLHVSGVPAPLNRDAAKQVVAMFSTAFPDLKHTVDEMLAEGNTVAARWTVRGTHQGDFQGIAPMGRPVVLSGTTVHHMTDGRISETWLTMDNLELFQQLGVAVQPSQV